MAVALYRARNTVAARVHGDSGTFTVPRCSVSLPLNALVGFTVSLYRHECRSSKAVEGRCPAVRKGALVLAPADPTDEHQHWFKDTRLSLRIKDEEGNPVFSLVNKATALAVQHPLGPNRPVRLLKFNPDDYVESALWTESGHLGRDFGRIRTKHDVDLVLEASPRNADDEYEIVLSEWAERDGTDCTSIVLSNSCDGDNLQWKISPWIT